MIFCLYYFSTKDYSRLIYLLTGKIGNKKTLTWRYHYNRNTALYYGHSIRAGNRAGTGKAVAKHLQGTQDYY